MRVSAELIAEAVRLARTTELDSMEIVHRLRGGVLEHMGDNRPTSAIDTQRHLAQRWDSTETGER